MHGEEEGSGSMSRAVGLHMDGGLTRFELCTGRKVAVRHAAALHVAFGMDAGGWAGQYGAAQWRQLGLICG